MAKKQRCPTCTSGWCKNHLLELIPLANNLYYRKTFKIRLCPKLNKQTTRFEKTIPLFNQDKKFYTPCFFLEEEKKYYMENDQRVKRNHMLKIDQEPNSKNTIVIHIQPQFLSLYQGMQEKETIVSYANVTTMITYNIQMS